MTEREIIERAKILLQAYSDMFNRKENYGKLLSECTVEYDDCECDSHCLKTDMEILIDDIDLLYKKPEEQNNEQTPN